MRTRYEYLCHGCHHRFVTDGGDAGAVACPRCSGRGGTLTALHVGHRRQPAVGSLTAYQGGRRWLGGCCSG